MYIFFSLNSISYRTSGFFQLPTQLEYSLRLIPVSEGIMSNQAHIIIDLEDGFQLINEVVQCIIRYFSRHNRDQ